MTAPPESWREVSAARLPTASLAALGPLRHRTDVRVHIDGATVWIVWPTGRDEVVRCMLPVPGVMFFARRGGHWFLFGSRLPSAVGPPDGEGRPIAEALYPAKFSPVPPGATAPQPVPLRITRGGEPRPVTSVMCRVVDLRQWADRATTAELTAVRGARYGPRAVLIGPGLPAIPGSTRYWGELVFVPVGFRAAPDLPPAALRDAVGAAADELVWIDADGAEVIPRSAFEPLTRAGLRLAFRGPVGTEGEGP